MLDAKNFSCSDSWLRREKIPRSNPRERSSVLIYSKKKIEEANSNKFGITHERIRSDAPSKHSRKERLVLRDRSKFPYIPDTVSRYIEIQRQRARSTKRLKALVG